MASPALADVGPSPATASDSATVILNLASIGLMGCDELRTSSTKHKLIIDTPSGTTTITTEKEVKETPDKPATKTP